MTNFDNFRLINIMFMDGMIVMSNTCGNLATILDLGTSQVSTDSPFRVNTAGKYSSITQDGSPDTKVWISSIRCTSPINVVSFILSQSNLLTTICFWKQAQSNSELRLTMI